MHTVQELTWTMRECYNDSWKGLIVDAAFAHPAKMSRGLLRKIFDFMFEIGELHRGDAVIDPFGGIGTTGIEAASRGVQAILCELEPRFVGMAKDNFDLHRRVWEAAGDPLPVILCGDSRNLCEVVGPVLAAVCVSSQPFSPAGNQPPISRKNGKPVRSEWRRMTDGNEGNYGSSPGQLGSMKSGDVADALVSSPPYAGLPVTDSQRDFNKRNETLSHERDGYGNTDGNLSSLSTGDVAAVVSSPPYADGGVQQGTEKHPERQQGSQSGQGSYASAVISSPPYAESSVTGDRNFIGGGGNETGAAEAQKGYGETPGQIGAMVSEGVDSVVSSPPWENQEPSHAQGSKFEEEHRRLHPTKLAKDRPGIFSHEYGDSSGQVGNTTGETFWSACRLILEQTHSLLKPDATTAWIVKSFVRKGKIVDFPGDWCKLLEATGFRVTHRIKAMLVEETTTPTLFNGLETRRKERKSFFRRLHEKKSPHTAINYEEVVIAVKE